MPCDSAVVYMCLPEDLHQDVLSSTIYTSHKLETAHLRNNSGINEYIRVYHMRNISNKNEETTVTHSIDASHKCDI